MARGCCPSCGGPTFYRKCLVCANEPSQKPRRSTDRIRGYEPRDGGSIPPAATTHHELRWKGLKVGRSMEWRAYSLGPEQTRLVYGPPLWKLPKTKEG